MKQESSTELQAGPSEVLELIERRDTVQGWLARLDEQRGKVSDRVLARVREDYQTRLRETLDALAGHRRLIQEELDRATSRLVEAEEEHQAAVDQLEEARLRSVIGEIDQDTWRKRESELTAAVETASAHESEIRGEARRLAQLLDQLDAREPEAATDSVLADADQALHATAGDTWLDEDQDETVEDFSDLDEDDADLFLGDKDRALVGATGASRAASADAADEPLPDTAPKPGLKCAECGYTNDLSAWFCGVCGADIG